MIYTEAEVREALKKDRFRYASDSEMAADIGISRQDFSAQMKGKRPPTGKLLRFLGFKRIIAYTGTGT